MKPLVAVVGRPNVGKSTLVNRIVGRREAIVQEQPGVTRDRKAVDAEWSGRAFTVVDTGGWLATDAPLDRQVSDQAERAITDADAILFVVDTTIGATDEDERVANLLRRSGRTVIVVANKVDSQTRELDIWAFSSFGLGDPMPVSALHGHGTGELLDRVLELLPEEVEPPEQTDTSTPAVAIVGRPNVGKSTLYNRILGDERSVVHDMPGTTRDSIDTMVESEDGPLLLIDTAGMRRKSRVGEGAEYYSLVRALQAIDRADVAVLMVDATEGVTHQDQRLAERIDAAGTAAVIVLNKWELLNAEMREDMRFQVGDRLGFLGYAPVLKISAKTALGVHKLLPAVREALEAYGRRVPTRELNLVIQQAQAAHAQPGVRILYATQGATDPPTFTLFTNRTVPAPYLRYLERKIREHFGFGPTPLKLRIRRRAS